MELRKFGPYKNETYGRICAACDEPFKNGDYSTLISLGPGDNSDEQRKCREKLPYNAVAKEVHWACATGEK